MNKKIGLILVIFGFFYIITGVFYMVQAANVDKSLLGIFQHFIPGLDRFYQNYITTNRNMGFISLIFGVLMTGFGLFTYIKKEE